MANSITKIKSKTNRAVFELFTEKATLEKEVGTANRSTQNRSAFQLYHDNRALENEKSLLNNKIRVLEAANANKDAQIKKLQDIGMLRAKIAELEKSMSSEVPVRSPFELGPLTDSPGGASVAVGSVAPRRVEQRAEQSKFSLFPNTPSGANSAAGWSAAPRRVEKESR